jgi:hypothetical protein
MTAEDELKELSVFIAKAYLKSSPDRFLMSCEMIRIIQKYGVWYADDNPQLDLKSIRPESNQPHKRSQTNESNV